MSNIDHLTSFLGVRVPQEVKKTVSLLLKGSIDQKSQYRRVLEPVFLYAEKGQEALLTGELTDDSIVTLAKNIQLSFDDTVVLFAGLLTIVQRTIRQNVDLEKVKNDLAAIRFPDVYIIDLCSALKRAREGLLLAAEQRAAGLPSLVDLSWRTDVAISTNTVAKAMQPTLLMRVKTSDGKQRTFSCDPEQFEQLRFGVAQLLQELNHVEQLNVLKMSKKK